jgi:hypothetical protein
MFICFVLSSCIFTLIHTLSTRGRRGELNEKFRKMHLIWNFASTCLGGACICSGGAFLLFSVWSLSFARLVTFLCLSLVLGHELSFFVSLSFYFLSLNFISRCVLSMHSSRGRLRIRSVPVVDGWLLLSDEWLTTGVGLTLGSVRTCCRWRTGAKGLQPWGASGRWRDK